jgi:microcystin-dependent protein
MAEDYLGAVKLFGGTFAPVGWAMCAGQTLPISQNTALYSLLGTTFGGDGVSTFQLPNLQSRLPIGQGAGAGLTPRIMGEMAGVESVTLTTATVPQHTHTFNASTTATNTNKAGPTVLLGALQAADGTFYAAPNEAGFAAESLNAQSVVPAGGSQPHNNIQPCLGVTYIIALEGIYPSRS